MGNPVRAGAGSGAARTAGDRLGHTSHALTQTPTETFTDLEQFHALTRKGVVQMKVKSNVKAGSYRVRGTMGGFEE